MLIGKFNRYFEKHGRATLLFILVVISVPFVIAFGPEWYALREGSLTDTGKVGWVNGRAFSKADLDRQLYAIELYQSIFRGGGALDWRPGGEMMQRAGGEALNRLRALAEARELGLDAVSDEEVAAELQRQAIFQTEDKKFDLEAFKNFRENYLKRRGLSGQDLDGIVREHLVIERLIARQTGALVNTSVDGRLSEADQQHQVTVEVANYTASSYLAEQTASDEEIASQFEQHKDGKYRTPAQRKLLVATYNAADFRPGFTPITDEEISQHYETNKATRYTDKLARVRHLLLKTSKDEAADSIAAKKQKLEDWRKDAAEKGNFEELAKAHSEDADSKDKGGDLGFVKPRTRFGVEAAKLKDGEISQVFSDSTGVHLLQKVEEKSEVRPLAEVRTQINNELRTAREQVKLTEIGQVRYAERLESKYKNGEVHARHILVKVAADASEEVNQKAEELAKKIHELATTGGKDFAELAKEYSEDAANKDKGGDLGKFGPGRMVEPFYQAAKALKPNEISQPVKTQFGWHIIQTLALSDLPYDQAKSEIDSEIRAEWDKEARNVARKLGHDLATKAYTVTDGLNGEAVLDAFRKAVTQTKPTPTLAESEFFADGDRSVRGIAGFTSDLVSKTANLSASNPVSDLVESGNYFYVACYLAGKPSAVPELATVREKVALDIRNDKALSKAREVARGDYATIKALLDAKPPKSFDEAKGAVSFQRLPEFNPRQGPQHAERALIQELVQASPAGTLTAPRETATGSLMVFVVSHRFPDASEMSSAMMGMSSSGMPVDFTAMLRQYEARQSFMQQLEKRLPTQLTPIWASALMPEAENAPATP